jgi:uncharacterized protein YwqG
MKQDLYQRVAQRVGTRAIQLLGKAGDGLSFLGGLPITSSGLEWPRKAGRPLAFLGQIDLGEMPVGEAAPWLPARGRLLFFYDVDEYPWGFDPADRGGWCVLYDDGDRAPTEQPGPHDLGDRLLSEKKTIAGKLFHSIPMLERVTLEEAGITEDEEDAYYDLVSESFDGQPQHQLGGFPDPVQGDAMEQECQLASGGVYCGDTSGYESREGKRLRAEPNDWRLLLQLDSDDDLGTMWGDAGMLYFWIQESDARAGNFSNVWLVLQCG